MTPVSLLEEMAHALGINRAEGERQASWTQRVILSACSAWLLLIIRHPPARPEDLSIISLKSRLREKAAAYFQAFKELMAEAAVMDDFDEKLTEALFDIHEKAGSFYHKPHYIFPAPEMVHIALGIQWHRNPSDPLCYRYSGAGAYVPCQHMETEAQKGDVTALYAAFNLLCESPSAMLKRLMKKRSPVPANMPAAAEYLNVFRQSREKEYGTRRAKGIDVLLARERVEGRDRYWLIHNEGFYELQPWEQEAGYHRYAELAILAQHKRLSAEARNAGSVVHLALSWRLPAPEERFLRFFAWPPSLLELENRWRYIVATPIYPMIRHRLIELGHEIEEVEA